MADIINGGFLSGKKTFITAGVGVIGALAAYLTGDASIIEAFQTIIVSLSAAGLRAGIAKS